MHMRTRMPADFAAVLLAAVLLTGCGEAGRDAPTMITKAPGSGRTTTAPSSPASTGVGPSAPAATSSRTAVPTVQPDPGSSATGSAIAALANSLVGTSFKLGGVGPAEFDNPGFVYYCYRQNGITVPRKASAMAAGGREVVRDTLQAGDIVVFSNEIGGTADFVGIYIGSGQFVSCNNPSQPTSVQSLSSGYWSERFLTARRYGD